MDDLRDDVSVFVNTFGGLYVIFGVQDARVDPATVLAPVEGGRGLVPNHNPAFYADEDSLQDSVRIHANVAVDHPASRTEALRVQRCLNGH